MITEKQETLAHELFQSLKAKFPEIELVGLIESPADPDSIWVNIIMPEDDDRQIDLREFAAEQATDILLDLDEHFSVVTGSYSIEIEFSHVRGPLKGDRYEKFLNIRRALGTLIRSRKAGVMQGMTDGMDGPLVISCYLRSLDFARTEIPRLLEQQKDLEDAIIYWKHLGRPERTQLYPPTGDGAV